MAEADVIEYLEIFKFGPLEEIVLNYDDDIAAIPGASSPSSETVDDGIVQSVGAKEAFSGTVKFQYRQSAVNALWTLRDHSGWQVDW